MAQVYAELNGIISAGASANIPVDFFPELKLNLTDAAASGGGLEEVTTDATLMGDGTALDALSVALPIPVPANPADDGKILTAGTGEVAWADAPSGLPDYSLAANGEVLTIVLGEPEWAEGTPGPTGATGATGAAGGWDSVQTIGTITANHTLVLGDAGKLLRVTAAAVITVPHNDTAAIAVGTHIDVMSDTTSSVTVAGAESVDIRSPYGKKFRVRYAPAGLVKLATNEWLLVGDLEEVT